MFPSKNKIYIWKLDIYLVFAHISSQLSDFFTESGAVSTHGLSHEWRYEQQFFWLSLLLHHVSSPASGTVTDCSSISSGVSTRISLVSCKLFSWSSCPKVSRSNSPSTSANICEHLNIPPVYRYFIYFSISGPSMPWNRFKVFITHPSHKKLQSPVQKSPKPHLRTFHPSSAWFFRYDNIAPAPAWILFPLLSARTAS